MKHAPLNKAFPLFALIWGCGIRESTVQEAPGATTVQTDPWVIVSHDPSPASMAYLTNGHVGIRISAEGKVLSSIVPPKIGQDGEWVPSISPTSPPPSLPDMTDYTQSLDLRTGIIKTSFQGTDSIVRLPVDGIDALTGPAALNDAATVRYWSDFWKTDIEVDGPIEDQLAIRSFLFYIRSSLHPRTEMAISPYGTSNSQYKGHVFWDADVWVFPALALIDPIRAERITSYRLRQQPQYEKNATGKRLRVPWESGWTGKEVGPPAESPEIHVTGSVCYGLDMAATLGIADAGKVKDFCEKADRFYQSQAIRAKDGVLELKSVGSVDESHTVDNDLYTNLLAQWLANRRSWVTGKVRYRIPEDARSLTTYSNDQDRSHKQAAAVLSVYPLQYPRAQQQALELVERYAPITIKQGPAMTDSVEATVLARASKTEDAYQKWLTSWKDFTKPPHMLFSEHRATQETYFVTGAAGCLQTVLYGFLGFRIDSQKDANAAWSTPLKQGKWLNAAPHLPKAWKKVRFKGLQVLGRSYTMTVTPSGVTVIRGD